MTNYDLEHLQGLIAGGVPVAANQVQFSLLDRRPLDSGMAEWCRANNVGLFTYGSVGGGFLSDRWVVTLRAAVVVVLVVTLVSLDSGQLRAAATAVVSAQRLLGIQCHTASHDAIMPLQQAGPTPTRGRHPDIDPN